MSQEQQKTTDRLKLCFETLDKSYVAWDDDKKDQLTRNELQKSLQEMRRVLARMEIELARSESDNRVRKAMPVPEHRSHKKGGRSTSRPEPGNVIDVAIETTSHHVEENQESEDSLPAFVTGDEKNSSGGKRTLRARTKKNTD